MNNSRRRNIFVRDLLTYYSGYIRSTGDDDYYMTSSIYKVLVNVLNNMETLGVELDKSIILDKLPRTQIVHFNQLVSLGSFINFGGLEDFSVAQLYYIALLVRSYRSYLPHSTIPLLMRKYARSNLSAISK